MGDISECLLVIDVFGLHGFGYTRLRKIINFKKIVRFTMRDQLYAIFGCTHVKVVFLWKNCSLFTPFSVYMVLSGT